MLVSSRALENLTVLIADQHLAVRSWLRSQLAQTGVRSALMAGNALEMMRICRNAAPDVVLCDYAFSDKRDGIQLLEELRFEALLPLSSVFMIVTAERVHRQVVAAAEFAPDDYLLKPFSAGDLGERLTRAIQKKRILRKVFKCMQERDYQGVVVACDRVLEHHPRHALDALRIKAEALVVLGRLEEAATIYRTVMQTSGVPWSRIGYAMVLCERGDVQAASDVARQVNEECPEFMGVYDFLGDLHERKGDLEQAREYFERADAIAPDNLRRLRRLAEIACEAGQNELAASTLRRVVKRTRGTSLGQLEDHLTLLKSLTALGPEHADEIRENLESLRTTLGAGESRELVGLLVDARVHAQRGDDESAKAYIDRALELHTRMYGADEALTADLAEACFDNDRIEAGTQLVERLTDTPGSTANRLARRRDQATSARERAAEAARKLAEDAIPEEFDIGIELTKLTQLLKVLDSDWKDELAHQCRETLIDVFTAAPRERKIIDAHIAYNRIAQKNGHERHKPTSRTPA